MRVRLRQILLAKRARTVPVARRGRGARACAGQGRQVDSGRVIGRCARRERHGVRTAEDGERSEEGVEHVEIVKQVMDVPAPYQFSFE